MTEIAGLPLAVFVVLMWMILLLWWDDDDAE